MYSRILVAVDNSDASKLALQEAIKLAKNQQAILRIVYVADEFIPAGEGVTVNFKEAEANIKQKGNDILNELVEQARRDHEQVDFCLIEIREQNDSIPRKIIDEANKWPADLIVLGTHGRRGLSRLLLGSVAEEVIRNVSIPVLVRNQK